ncbi:MAG: AraC family transcriptional regulator [Bacteroidaceae bacterium]|nr:AraC family transcriptional regulator [Bacteroidaceae bacterium]
MSNKPLPFDYVSVHDIALAFDAARQMSTAVEVCGFFLCQRGHAEVIINEHNCHISRGDVYFYTPSTYVSVTSISDDLEGIAVKCQLDFVFPLLERIANGQQIMMVREDPCVHLTEEQQQSLEQMTSMLQAHQQLLFQSSPSSGSYHVLQQLVISIAESTFYELLYYYADKRRMAAASIDGLDRVFYGFLYSLLKHCREQREVAYYAEEQCLSPRYFSSIIKKKSGRSALQWIIQMVISAASQQLLYTDKSIKEIAQYFNFPSQSFFGKYFKQYVGVGPKEFRNMKRGGKG